jgi:fermentation-respiration switch protein FrsA (DUF1100 family)
MFIRRALPISIFLASSALLPAQTASTAEDTGRRALDLLLSEKYSELSAMFSEKFRQTVTLDFLQQRVSAELKEFGERQHVGQPVFGIDGTNHLVSFPVSFSNTSIHVQFTLDESNRIAGMYFRPPDKPLPDAWKRPSYSKPESFHERELTIGSDKWKLGGTLTFPASKGKVPGIVLVHGPGPNDRDESLFANRVFRDLAEGLASRGYAILRYDKRTKVYGEELSETGYTIEGETVEDATRAASLLRKQPEIDPARIVLIGHSLGGYASPMIAARDGKIAALILMAAPARPIEDVAFDQTDYVARLRGEPGSNEQTRLNQLRAEVDRVKSLDPKGDNPPVLLGLPVGWWLSLKGYAPVAETRRLGIPVLVMQGERDFQVTMKDFALWKSGLDARNRVTFHSYPSLNNLLIKGEGKGSPAEYHVPGNVASEVVDDIAAWLASLSH